MFKYYILIVICFVGIVGIGVGMYVGFHETQTNIHSGFVFQKPNTEWKERDITLNDGRTLHYVFGEGNPKEVSLTEKEQNTYKNCIFEDFLKIQSCGSLGNEVFGYITPDVEKDLLRLMNNPALGQILTSCRSQFEASEYPTINGDEASYAHIMSSDGWMDMENIMEVNDQNGRKFLSNRFKSFMVWFQNALLERREVFGKDILATNNCITQNGGMEIYREMDNISMKMFYPFGNYPDRLSRTGAYIPWHY